MPDWDPVQWFAVLGIAALVVQTWFLNLQLRRENRSRQLETFFRFRDRAIEHDGVLAQRRTAALVRYCEEHRILTRHLRSPDVRRYLNDIDWIGRLVQEGLVEFADADSTFGGTLRMVYHGLEDHIDYWAKKREYPELWSEVGDFYEMVRTGRGRPLWMWPRTWRRRLQYSRHPRSVVSEEARDVFFGLWNDQGTYINGQQVDPDDLVRLQTEPKPDPAPREAEALSG